MRYIQLKKKKQNEKKKEGKKNEKKKREKERRKKKKEKKKRTKKKRGESVSEVLQLQVHRWLHGGKAMMEITLKITKARFEDESF